MPLTETSGRVDDAGENMSRELPTEPVPLVSAESADDTEAVRTDLRATMRRPLGSLRLRVVVGYVLLLALALGASVLVTRQVLLARLDREIDAALEQEVAELRRVAAGTNPETGQPFGMDVTAIFETFLRSSVPGEGEAFYAFVAGEPLARSVDAPTQLFEDPQFIDRWGSLAETEAMTIDTDVGEARVLATPILVADVRLGTFVVAIYPAEARDDVLQSVRIILIIMGVVLVLASIAAWTAAGRVLRPVRDLTETARTISDRELTARIPVTGSDEISELAATFNAMLDRLEEAFRFQREFMDDIAHELRTPITIVRGHLEVLDDDPSDREETVEMVTEELDRMNRSVTDLLVLAKSERPDFLHVDRVDLGETVEAAFARARALGNRDWRLDDVPGGVVLDADEDRIIQALLALADNAVRYTGVDDVVALGARISDGRAELWVRDTGPGVAESDRERIFTRFQRASHVSGGTGLGLAIVGAIARAHHGTVHLDTDYAEGARFVVSIPLERVAAEPVGDRA